MNLTRCKTLRFGLPLALLLALTITGASRGANTADALEHEWKFKVLLDGSEIGYHNFSLSRDGQETRLKTEANFKVKFLFITAFRYEHENSEIWRNDCLASIEASTDANGRKFLVNGNKADSVLRVEANKATERYEGCIKSFAYWNADIVNESQLLNSQTGELLPVDIEQAGVETLVVRGEEVPATRYQLEARDIKVDVWYSPDDRWLALESTVKGGRKLRYELI